MKRTILPATLILLGFTIGWQSVSVQSPPDSEAPSRLSPRQARDRAKSNTHAIPADIAEKLRPIHSARNPAERLRAVIHLAQTLPVSELHRWYDAKWLSLKDGGDLNVFYEITRNRWLAEDPAGLMDHARLKNWTNLNEIAEQLSRTNPDAALAYLESLRNAPDRRSLLEAMTKGLAESRPEALLSLINDQFDPQQGTHSWTPAFHLMAKQHPGLLENAELPISLRELARISLVSARLEMDFNGELTRLTRSPTGLIDFSKIMEDYNLSRKFTGSLLENIHQIPAAWLDKIATHGHYLIHDNAAEWLEADLEHLGMKPTTAKLLRDYAWQNLATSDPTKFFKLSNDLDLEQILLQKNNLSNALRTLSWKNAEEANQWLDYYLGKIDDDATRKLLTNSVSKPDESDKITAETLQARLESAKTEPGLLSNLPYDLSNAGPESMQAFKNSLANMTSEELAALGNAFPQHSLSHFPTSVRADLIQAMIQHPLPQAAENQNANTLLVQTSEFTTSWAADDPVAASRWAQQLPAGEPRQWALRNLAASWMPFEPTAAEAWLKKLPASDQSDVRKFLESNGNGNR